MAAGSTLASHRRGYGNAPWIATWEMTAARCQSTEST